MSGVITKRRFTADEYHRMGEAGILRREDRVELIDGEVVAMSPIGRDHNSCVTRTMTLLVRAVDDDAIVQCQGPVRLSSYDEPQPDIVLLKPRSDYYRNQLPGVDDVLLVVEITDSSIAYDRGIKSRMYARFAIPEYWVADVNGEVVLRFTDPTPDGYRTMEEYRRGQSLAPALLPECVLDADVLL